MNRAAGVSARRGTRPHSPGQKSSPAAGKGKELFLAGTFLVGAVCVALLVGLGASGHPREAAATQQRAFAILRGQPDPLPSGLARRMETVVEGRGFGLEMDLAQRVRTRIGEDAWVVPGRGYVCVMASTPIVAGCNTTAATIRDGMSVVAIHRAAIGGGKQYDLFGIAPDGVREVSVAPETGRRVLVPVIDNVYSYAAPSMLHARLVRSQLP